MRGNAAPNTGQDSQWYANNPVFQEYKNKGAQDQREDAVAQDTNTLEKGPLQGKKDKNK